jgi:Ca2+-transporting ATPase
MAYSDLKSGDACVLSAQEVLEKLASSGEVGLSHSEVEARLSRYGHNELPEEEDEPLWRKFLDKLREPMIALLMASAAISLLTGQYNDAISIFMAVLIVVVVAFVQEYKSDQSLAALSKLAPHKCVLFFHPPSTPPSSSPPLSLALAEPTPRAHSANSPHHPSHSRPRTLRTGARYSGKGRRKK